MEQTCPDCGHERGQPQGQPWYVGLLRLRPRPARCHERTEDASGWGDECGCTAPFHGS